MLFSDLYSIKRMLEIDANDHSEDLKLAFLNTQCSAWLEEALNRKFTKQSRTEYYNGTGTRKLLLRSRPVFTTPTIQVFSSLNGFWGQTSGSFDSNSALTFGTDFFLWIDQDDGTSRSGILVRNNQYWIKPNVRAPGLLTPFMGEGFGNIKVVYTAGYSVDTLPANFRLAAVLLISRLRYLLPLGLELTGESYEERNLSLVNSEKNKLMDLVFPMIRSYANWSW